MKLVQQQVTSLPLQQKVPLPQPQGKRLTLFLLMELREFLLLNLAFGMLRLMLALTMFISENQLVLQYNLHNRPLRRSIQEHYPIAPHTTGELILEEKVGSPQDR